MCFLCGVISLCWVRKWIKVGILVFNLLRKNGFFVVSCGICKI